MKTLFVDPFGDKESKGLNIGIAYCAANLRKHGHRVSLLDLNNIPPIGNDKARLRKAVDKYRPDAVAFSVMNLSYYGSIDLANDLRSYYRGVIIFGGIEISAQKERVFSHTDSLDIAVLGEGEAPLLDIATLYDKEQMDQLGSVPGIAWKNDGRIVVNRHRKPLDDLDSLPFPDYEIFGVKSMNNYLLLTSRGCPFSCSFCFSFQGPDWRGRDTGRCIEELKYVIDRYKINVFQVCDPCFNASIKRVEDFCDLLIKEKIDLPWSVIGMRADRVTDAMAEKMRRSGCRRISIGIESLDEKVFNQIGKSETIEDIKKGIRIFKSKGIQINGYLIIGLPGDTLRRSIRSFEEAQRLDVDLLSYSTAVPYSGTRLERWIKEGNARPVSDRHNVSIIGTKYDSIAFETDDFPKEDRIKARRILNVKAQVYNEPGLSRWLFYLKKIGLVIRYDAKNLLHHAIKSVKYRLGDREFDDLVHAYFIRYSKIPDGTWDLSDNEDILDLPEVERINLRG